MTKLDPPLLMTEREANEKFYPDSYVMKGCYRVGWDLHGYVVAHAPLGNEELSDYANKLFFESEPWTVTLSFTKDPFDGRWLHSVAYIDEAE